MCECTCVCTSVCVCKCVIKYVCTCVAVISRKLVLFVYKVDLLVNVVSHSSAQLLRPTFGGTRRTRQKCRTAYDWTPGVVPSVHSLVGSLRLDKDTEGKYHRRYGLRTGSSEGVTSDCSDLLYVSVGNRRKSALLRL